MTSIMTPSRVKLLRLIHLHAREVASPGTFFELSGGAKVAEYINIKRASMCAAVQDLLGTELAENLETFGPVDAVAGIVLGGCHLASLVSSRTKLDVLFVRKVSKDHGRTPGFIEGYISKGSRVVLLDDIVSAGKSAAAAIGHLKDADLDVRGMITIIDKRRERPGTLADGTPIRSLFTIDELIYGSKGSG